MSSRRGIQTRAAGRANIFSSMATEYIGAMHNFGIVLGQRGHLTVRECNTCGFAHLVRRPGEKYLEAFYADRFWQKEKEGAPAKIEQQLDWWRAIWGDWLHELAPLCQGNTLMDFGAGFGHFVALAREQGWAAEGLEPSPAARIYAREKLGLELSPAMASTWLKNGTDVDSAAAMWLLEHLRSPLQFLQELAFHASALLLVIPNEWTPAQQLANERAAKPYWWIDHTHINYFTKESLGQLLEKAGWEAVSWMATYQVEDAIIAGHDYTDDPSGGARIGAGIRTTEMEMPADMRRGLYHRRGQYGTGRDLIVIARSR